MQTQHTEHTIHTINTQRTHMHNIQTLIHSTHTHKTTHTHQTCTHSIHTHNTHAHTLTLGPGILYPGNLIPEPCGSVLRVDCVVGHMRSGHQTGRGGSLACGSVRCRTKLGTERRGQSLACIDASCCPSGQGSENSAGRLTSQGLLRHSALAWFMPVTFR